MIKVLSLRLSFSLFLSLSLSFSLSLSLSLSLSMHSHSFQDTKFKLLIQVKDFQEQVVEGLTILRYPVGLRNKGLITQKTLVRHAFAQFLR